MQEGDCCGGGVGELLLYFAEQCCEGLVGGEGGGEVVVKLVLGEVGGEDQGGGEEAEDGVCRFFFFQMLLYSFLRLCQGCGHLFDVKLVVLLHECLFHFRVGGDDGGEVGDWDLVEEDMTLEELTPDQETCSLPHFHGSCGELGEEGGVGGEVFVLKSATCNIFDI